MIEKENERIEYLIEVLELYPVNNRYATSWGTKTRQGLIATIKRIVYDKDTDFLKRRG